MIGGKFDDKWHNQHRDIIELRVAGKRASLKTHLPSVAHLIPPMFLQNRRAQSVA